LHSLLDEVNCYKGLSNGECYLRCSQNSHNATRNYQKFYSGGFSATEEEVDGEQKEGDVDACDPTQLVAKHGLGHNPP
jgi:hypothetical protein